ncbi:MULTISPECIES: flagellar hook assembly protein FlgD [Ancylobacter]|uniref:Basal-body rod modification protein FlgD n=1 Tax=Ancylobacter polymorphus TaxID=223390 RepID=A0A9E7D6X1_9HYPH|nr:flagellar hook assembly protein FlgD [Ancylobacter polymorphus]MPT24339.1 flagellar hook assembly protein FlgD [Starkeya sp.]UOK72725.1 flagellar hook assembly protein FlgD [Ancylobacter polymorphus]
MTSINALGGSTSAAAPAKSGGSTLDYSAFLQLLVAQMKTQDPTKPMDSAQYLGQLASFSQVEQSVSANAKLDRLLTSSALQIADAAVGRTVTSADGSVTGQVASVRITSEAPVATLTDGREITLGSGIRIA